MAFGKAELIEALEKLRPNTTAPELSERSYRQACDDCTTLARQLDEPAAVDEEVAIRAMWSVDFGVSLLMYIEDVKRGVDSSDDVRRAAYQALRPYLRTPQHPIPAEQESNLEALRLINAALSKRLASLDKDGLPIPDFNDENRRQFPAGKTPTEKAFWEGYGAGYVNGMSAPICEGETPFVAEAARKPISAQAIADKREIMPELAGTACELCGKLRAGVHTCNCAFQGGKMGMTWTNSMNYKTGDIVTMADIYHRRTFWQRVAELVKRLGSGKKEMRNIQRTRDNANG